MKQVAYFLAEYPNQPIVLQKEEMIGRNIRVVSSCLHGIRI